MLHQTKEQITVTSDGFVNIDTLDAFNSWASENGYTDADGFSEAIGIDATHLLGKWFKAIDSSIKIK